MPLAGAAEATVQSRSASPRRNRGPMANNPLRRAAWACAAAFLLAAPLAAAPADQKNDKAAKDTAEAKRPKMVLKAQPIIGIAPARVVLTAELVGGANDFEDFYCPSIEWEWGDGTRSESSADCAPYEPGKSEIRRRYTVEHVFRRFGNFRVYFHLKRQNKPVASASVTLQVRQGLPEG